MSLSSEFAGVQALLNRLADNQTALGQLRDLLANNIEREKHLMSQITDWAAQEQADLTAISNTLDTVVSGIAALDALITQFQNSPGTLSPSDQAALDGIQAASKALVTKSSAISVTPPVPTPPVPPAV
jgi:predicted metal-dependent enzyme (double-stranded beta helix superfamily)